MPDPARSVLGNQPDPDLQLPLGPGEASAREVVLVGEPAALTDDELQGVFDAARQETSHYNDLLANARTAALNLYNGGPLGDEEEGRSRIVLTEVRDTIAALMPTVIRIFAGAGTPVEFAPTSDGDEEQAKQATEYVQHVAFTECDGFRAIHDSALDSFQLKAGWIHWWWDTAVDVKTESYTGLLEPQCAALITQAGVKAMRVVRRPATEDERLGIAGSPESQIIQTMPGVPLLVFDVTLNRRVARNRPRIMARPSEQVWIDPDASGPHDARALMIVRDVTVSDLVALGFHPDAILPYARTTDASAADKVERKRDPTGARVTRISSSDPSMKQVTYTEGWIKVDYDGDGIAELRRIQAVGDRGEQIIAHEGASHIPVARICPFFVPHRAIGESYADRVGDLQRIGSRVMRNILDSMAEAIHPRTVVVDGQVAVDDVMNTEMGAVIRERQVNSVRELSKPFIGPQALPLLDTLAAIKETRTGITRGSQGLTAEALQSTAPIAVSAQIAASQDRIELSLRCIAEGLRHLYAGVLTLMCEHQDRARMVRLRNKWVPVDPRAWIAGFNVVVDVAGLRGTTAERMQVLGTVASKQEQVLQTMGLDNPLVTLGQYRNTLADMLGAAGIANTDRYFQDVAIAWKPPDQPKQPSPDELLANVEIAKSNNKARTDALDTRQKQQQMLLDDDRERDQSKVTALLQAAEMIAKYGHPFDVRQISALLDRDPNLTADILMSQGPPGIPGGAPGAPGAPPGAPPGALPPAPAAGPAQPGQSLADARVFLPPPLIMALAQMDRAASAAPPPGGVR